MLTHEQQNKRTAYIKAVQDHGIIFVCPSKDRALRWGEEACKDCHCMSDDSLFVINESI